MAILVSQSPDGFTPVAASGGGDQVPQGGWSPPAVLFVANGDVAAHTVTVNGRATVVAAGDSALISVSGVYSGNLQSVTYDAVTSVTVAAVDLGS
jgi:hypothetical protein